MRYIEALTKASVNAQHAFEVAFSPEYSQYPAEQRQIWAAATILHCDILRYIVTFENSTTKGLVRLLWIGDIVSMLYEAKEWFYRKGSPDLAAIADAKGYGKARVFEEIKSLKNRYPLGGISHFADYRNKVGHHYDREFVAHLYYFSETDAGNFYTILANYAKFSSAWAALCKDVLAYKNESVA